MYTSEVLVALKGYAVESVSKCGKTCSVVIGNAGKDCMGRRTFKAASFETIIRQVKKTYGEIPENAK